MLPVEKVLVTVVNKDPKGQFLYICIIHVILKGNGIVLFQNHQTKMFLTSVCVQHNDTSKYGMLLLKSYMSYCKRVTTIGDHEDPKRLFTCIIYTLLKGNATVLPNQIKCRVYSTSLQILPIIVYLIVKGSRLVIS